MNLWDYTTERLEEELERRRKIEEDKTRPREFPPSRQNWEPIRKMCREYIEDLATGKYADDGIKQYIYEAAMEAMYGDTVWKWINLRLL